MLEVEVAAWTDDIGLRPLHLLLSHLSLPIFTVSRTSRRDATIVASITYSIVQSSITPTRPRSSDPIPITLHPAPSFRK